MSNSEEDQQMKYPFEIMCQYKDINPSNLNEKFEKYGCSLLEAKVPVVSMPVASSLQECHGQKLALATLALKSESATMANRGRRPMTAKRDLKLVQVGRDIIISAGEVRERSPISKKELDDELDEYMKDRIDRKFEITEPRATTSGTSTSTTSGSSGTLTNLNVSSRDNIYQQVYVGHKPTTTPGLIATTGATFRRKIKVEEAVELVKFRAGYQNKPNETRPNNRVKDFYSTENIDEATLDRELEEYRLEGLRRKEQQARMMENADRMAAMNVMDDLDSPTYEARMGD